MKIILVDGYNVIHQSPFLKALLSRSISRAQSQLVEMVCNYCSLLKMKGCVVFDAYRRSFQEEVEISPLVKVIYTGEGKTADSYIEKFIAENKSRYSLIYVITSDYSEGMTVLDKFILPISPKNFLGELESCRKYIQKNFSSTTPFTNYPFSHDLPEKIRKKLKRKQ